jgi:CRP-like cAMP-binding protein
MSYDLIELMKDMSGQQHSFDEGTFLFHQGDVVVSLFIIVTGCAELIRHQASGNAITIQRARNNSILAEASVFSNRYHCDAIAAESSAVITIPCRQVRLRLQQDPGFAEAWTEHLARELQWARLRCEILSLKTVAARLDLWLSWHEGNLPLKGEWKTMADQIGVSSEALYRELAKRRHR